MENTDEMYIKLLANSKKISKTKVNTQNNNNKSSLSDKHIQKFLSYLEKDLMCYSTIQNNFDEFITFLQRYSPRIVASFEKSITGKDL